MRQKEQTRTHDTHQRGEHEHAAEKVHRPYSSRMGAMAEMARWYSLGAAGLMKCSEPRSCGLPLLAVQST